MIYGLLCAGRGTDDAAAVPVLERGLGGAARAHAHRRRQLAAARAEPREWTAGCHWNRVKLKLLRISNSKFF